MIFPTWLRKELRQFSEIATKKIHEYIVLGLFAVLLGALAFLWVHIERLLVSTLQVPIAHWQIQHILTFAVSYLSFTLSVVAFVIVMARLRKTIAPPKSDGEIPEELEPPPPKPPREFRFLEFGGFKWKYFTDQAIIESMPYCREHQLKLFFIVTSYHCAICKAAKSNHLTHILIGQLRDGAQTILDATIQQHLTTDK